MKDETEVDERRAPEEMTGRVSAMEGIQRGLAQAKKGLGRSVDEVFNDLERNGWR